MWLSDLHLVLPETVLERGSLRIEGGRIAEVREGPAPGPAWQARGLTALPGIIDLHGDMLERELEPRPGTIFPTDMAILELDKRLAAAGMTTSYAALSFVASDSPDSVRSEEQVRDIIARLEVLRPTLLVDTLIHARFEVATPSIAPFLAEMLAARTVHMLSLMDHTPGQGQYRNIEHYISYIARFRGTDRALVADEIAERMRTATDAAITWEQARAMVQAAAAQGLPIASHDDDTHAKVDLVASLGVTISEFPVTLEAAQAARHRGLHIVMGAPNVLRGGSHSGNLSALDALDAGLVDSLAADYYPAAPLHAALLLARRGILPLPAAARLISQQPAAALGLTDRGSIAVGKSADLTLVELGAPAECPRVRATLRRGLPIYQDGYLAHQQSEASNAPYR